MTWDWWTTNNIDLDKMKYFWRGNVSGVCQISCTHVYKAAVFFVFLILSFGTGFLSWSKSNIELRSDDTTILNSEWQNKSQWKKLASIQGGRMKFWWYNRSEKSSSICRHSTQKKKGHRKWVKGLLYAAYSVRIVEHGRILGDNLILSFIFSSPAVVARSRM